MSDSIANRNDECIDGMKESKAQCNQTHLLPAQHPAIQPIREAPGTKNSAKPDFLAGLVDVAEVDG